MIEMRWLEREIKACHPAMNALAPKQHERVLQYRTWRVLHTMDVPDGHCSDEVHVRTSMGEANWTDWQDVPTVVEDA